MDTNLRGTDHHSQEQSEYPRERERERERELISVPQHSIPNTSVYSI